MPLLPFSGPVIPTPVPISKGGTGSPTQNFVDLSSTAQTKTGGLTVGGLLTASTGVKLANGYLYDSNGNKALQLPPTTSAVNYLQLSNKAAGGIPIFGVDGSDTNISIAFATKGTGIVQFQSTALQFSATQANPQIYQVTAFSTGAGYPLTLLAQAAQPSTTDTNGGALVLSGGAVTGAGESQIQFKTAGGNTSGTSGYSPTLAWTIDGTGNFYPAANNTQNIASSTNYAKYIYGSRLYLNSTAYLDGGTAGQITVSANYLYISGGSNNTMLSLNGTGTSVSLQLNSTATGFHNYQFYASSSGAKVFGVYDATEGSTPLAVYGGTNSSGVGSYVAVDINAQIGWTSSNASSAAPDTYMTRVSAGVIGVPGLSVTDGDNIVLGTTTGTQIAAATNQKLGFWAATPIVQPTTGVAGATYVNNAGTALTSTDTFDGYTIAQVVKALRTTGLLA